MNAEEAKSRAIQVAKDKESGLKNSEIFQKDYNNILKLIDSTANDGRFSCSITIEGNVPVRLIQSELKALGFIVTAVTTNNTLEGWNLVISW